MKFKSYTGFIILNLKTWIGDYSAPISPVDILKPPPNIQSEVLSEN